MFFLAGSVGPIRAQTTGGACPVPVRFVQQQRPEAPRVRPFVDAASRDCAVVGEAAGLPGIAIGEARDGLGFTGCVIVVEVGA